MARSILRGDEALRQALSGIPKLVAAGMDAAVRDSLEPMRKEASLNALRLRQAGTSPVGGHLDQGIVVRKVDGRGISFRKFWVSLTKRARYTGHLVEFGTAPHWQPNRKIMHPGARPKPFFTPAFEANKDDAVVTLGQKTWALISGAASKYGRVRQG